MKISRIVDVEREIVKKLEKTRNKMIYLIIVLNNS